MSMADNGPVTGLFGLAAQLYGDAPLGGCGKNIDLGDAHSGGLLLL